jgi:hypothetical protein
MEADDDKRDDKDAAKPVVDRLKAEGQLIRNTGTNSIRSVNVRLDKFSELFQSMNVALGQQTTMMSAALGIQQAQLLLDQESAEREKTRDELNKVSTTTAANGGPGGGPVGGGRSGGGAGDDGSSGGWTGLGALFTGGLGGGAAFALLRTFASRFLFRFLPALLLAPAVVDGLDGFLETTLQGVGLLDDAGFSEQFRNNVISNLSWPLIGFAIGGWWGAKIGAMFAVGSMLWSYMNDIFNLDEHMDKIADAFGLNLPDGWQGWVGSAIGFAIISIVPAIIRRALVPLLMASVGALVAGATGLAGLAGTAGAAARARAAARAAARAGGRPTPRPSVAGLSQRLAAAGRTAMTVAPRLLRGTPLLAALIPDTIAPSTLTNQVDTDLEARGITPESVGSDQFEAERAAGLTAVQRRAEDHNSRYADMYENHPEEMLQIDALLAQLSFIQQEVDRLRETSVDLTGNSLQMVNEMIENSSSAIERIQEEISRIESSVRIPGISPIEPPETPPSPLRLDVSPDMFDPEYRQRLLDILEQRRRDQQLIAPDSPDDLRQGTLRSISENALAQVQTNIYAPTNYSPTTVVQGPTSYTSSSPTNVVSISSSTNDYGGLAGLA